MRPYLLPGHTTPTVAYLDQAAPARQRRQLHRAMQRPGSDELYAGCGLVGGWRLDPTTVVPVEKADPSQLCRGAGCRMRAWPAAPRKS